MMRCGWINKADADKVALRRQCVLASVCRATLYARQKPRAPVQGDEALKRLIDEEYTRSPFYGSRKMVAHLRWTPDFFAGKCPAAQRRGRTRRAGRLAQCATGRKETSF